MRCSSCQSDNASDASRCRTCGSTLRGAGSVPPVDDAEAERREATLLFADLGGYSEWTVQADVEEVAGVMEAVKNGAADIVETYGGVVNQFVGDEVMAVFGFPHGNEDDPRRAVSAALELNAFIGSPRLQRMLRGVRKLAFHTGIDTGLVLAQSRDPRDGVFDLVGSAVNRAAHLRTAAGRGEVLVSDATHARVAPFFRTQRLETRVGEAKGEAVLAHRVEALAETRSSFDVALQRGLTPYVGRRRELATLEGYLADAGRGEARSVALAGPAGVGKTRLVHELATRAQGRGFCVLRGHCQSYGSIPPFQPFLETLQQAVGFEPGMPEAAARVATNVCALDASLERHVPVYLYLLGIHGGPRALTTSLSGHALRRAVIEALGALLIALSKSRPVLVIVEDWHWADEASDTLYRELARATRGQAIMALTTYRDDQLREGRMPVSNRRLVLGHFDGAGTQEMLRELLSSQQLPDGLSGYVYEVTGGNPFYIEEVFHTLRDAGVLTGPEPRWALSRPVHELEPPSSVQAMVRARIDRLDREDKELLKLASVIGAEFSLELLELLHDGAKLLAAMLRRLEERAHVVPTGLDNYRFKHAIVQEVVYNVLLLRRRRELHGRIAQVLEARHQEDGLEPLYETLAYHYARSDHLEQAARYAELAGRKAERSLSLDQAQRQYADAIDALDALEPTQERLRKRVDLSLRWAAALVHNPTPPPGPLRTMERSLEIATDLGYIAGVARCLCWMGWTEYTVGNQQRAIRFNERCLALRHQLDEPALFRQVRANVGMSYVMAARYAQARACFEQTLSAQAGEEDPAGYGYALAHRGLMAADCGDFEAARADLARARAAVESSGRYALLGAIATTDAMAAMCRGDWDACSSAASRVRAVASRIHGAYQEQMAAALEGLGLYYGYRDVQGLERVRVAVEHLHARGMGLALSWCMAMLAEALVFEGRAREALEYARAAVARKKVWDGLGEAAALRAMALASHALGMDGEAHVQASLDCARAKQSPRDRCLTELFWARQTGTQVDASLLQQLEELGMSWYVSQG